MNISKSAAAAMVHRLVGGPLISRSSSALLMVNKRVETKWNVERSVAAVNDHRKNQIAFNVEDWDDFNWRVMQSRIPILVDFHADWCGSCLELAPRLLSIVKSHEGKVLLARVNMDENQEIAVDYGVEVVPTIIALKRGVQQPDKLIGKIDDNKLTAYIQKLLKE